MAGAVETWADGEAYEAYIGRWSRKLAPLFLEWAEVPRGGSVVDVGCGTGALSRALLERGSASVVGVDKSPDFIALAARELAGERARFEVGDAASLPLPAGSFDAAVSALCLNFVPNPAEAVAEMRRVVKPGGTVAACVWDYAGRMEIVRQFWDAAVELFPARAGPLHEGTRFAICHPRPLEATFVSEGLAEVSVAPVDVEAEFPDFEAYWRPFLRGGAPAPSFAQSLSPDDLAQLRARLVERLPDARDGSIKLTARAWAARGVRP